MKWPLLLMGFLLPNSYTFGAPNSHSGCEFPPQWRGSWFQSGENTLITINGTRISNKGDCIGNKGDMFVIFDRDDRCSRCLVMHEKHANVIQYKETTFCTSSDVADICQHLDGDATLYSLFRYNAAPSPCPLSGPLEFTYTSGGDPKVCGSPRSQADACTQDSKLLLRYMACADVYGTESVNVEMECLATWKEGSTQYLVARLNGSGIVNDERKYRCFAYAKSGNSTWNLAQSGDASCNGLTSATDGAKTLTMMQKPESSRCHFPGWLVEPHSWVALDLSSSTRLLASVHSVTILNKQETLYTCQWIIRKGNRTEIKIQSDNIRRFQIVARVTRGCVNGFVCMVLHKRDDHVIEMQQSLNWTQEADDACKPNVFNPFSAPYTTFITMEPKTKECPYLGRYDAVLVTKPLSGTSSAESAAAAAAPPVGGESRHGETAQHPSEHSDHVAEVRAADTASLSTSSSVTAVRCHQARVEALDIGCTKPDLMEFATDCHDKAPFKYSCHGTWVEDDRSYLVASTEAGRYCLVYSASASTPASTPTRQELTITGHLASCPRAPHSHTHEWQVNLTAHGECDKVSSASTWRSSGSSHTIHVLFVLGGLVIRYFGR